MIRGWLCATLLAVSASLAAAAPPNLKLPDVIPAKEQYVRFTPDTDAKSVFYIGLSGVEAFPSDELKDGRRFLLDTRGLPQGKYQFAAVAASATGEQVRANFTVVVGPVTDQGGTGGGPITEGEELKKIRADYKALIDAVKAIPADAALRTAVGTAYLDLAKAIKAKPDITLDEVNRNLNARYAMPPLTDEPALKLILAVGLAFNKAVAPSAVPAEIRRAYIALADAFGVPAQ